MLPQGRYEIMRNYMPKVGSLGLDMMFRTSTVQVSSFDSVTYNYWSFGWLKAVFF